MLIKAQQAITNKILENKFVDNIMISLFFLYMFEIKLT